jgi:hypothetical protein
LVTASHAPGKTEVLKIPLGTRSRLFIGGQPNELSLEGKQSVCDPLYGIPGSRLRNSATQTCDAGVVATTIEIQRHAQLLNRRERSSAVILTAKIQKFGKPDH